MKEDIYKYGKELDRDINAAINITFREAGNFIEKINISNPVIIKLYIVPILFNITKIIRNALNIPHTNYYKFISLTTNFYNLLQILTVFSMYNIE